MYPKLSEGEGNEPQPLRTSDRLRRKPKSYHRNIMYYNTSLRRPKKNKPKGRASASKIARLLQPGSRPGRKPSASVIATNLRRSSRKRIAVRFDGYIDSSMEDEDLMKRTKITNSTSVPRREGLRPRQSNTMERIQSELHSDEEEQDLSNEKVELEKAENDDDGDDSENDGEGEGDNNGDQASESDGEDEAGDDGDDDEVDDEQDGCRRYDLRNRAEVRRMSTYSDSGKQRPRSPRRILHQGMGNKVSREMRKGGSRVHKRHRLSGRMDDSDDSLLVDELDQGPMIPWSRSGNRSGTPWLFGGLDMHGTTAWGLNVAATGWGHQTDALAAFTSGIQTAGPSSKGGGDIQPLQVDESVSFDDIGGLSEYIDALKEMVFFPLLYPEFFASYHITPPRGVLLCGPPGTGKTLIARALACAASKSGQKVSFYMRKGADVLSKWVGEAERQLKMLFEEAQKNQPSIIFFDEIDGLAPVRSSKQEQIHNSIVSTLLALMDGLDSRGQVVLIGATNRIDAIDGALRRPGRFDREFNFPLPGCKARADILDIHTRKWKRPPSKELRLELAASCVGYCGADLKALCTEAAIRAFREMYPQVYTSDDRFLIDVESVKVEKYHFTEAMATITPAAHRGSIVQSRPLSSAVAPCLKRHLQAAMSYIADIFPPVAVSSDMVKLSVLSYGSTFPLVYRPRLLLHGSEGVGLDHLGPAILHELEKFPVHFLGLASLLSDLSAKTPEEALVHIFGEARRTIPSILYLPQFHLWWETAHEQLRAVLLTLLEELPSDVPILLFGVAQEAPDGLDDLIFPKRTVYQVGKPSTDDRDLFFSRMIEAAVSVSDVMMKESPKSFSAPDLHKAPKIASVPKASEVKAKFECEQHALRRLRMCLRDVCNRILYDKRFSAFHYPVKDEDAPNYRMIVNNPMDMATMLQRVDYGHYITCSTFLQDIDLIVSNALKYNGEDYFGTRIVSRAHELRDAVQGMLAQMDPALVTFCDKIAAQGGPIQLPDYIGGLLCPNTPVAQHGTTTRASARIRNVEPDLNLDQSFEALKRSKKHLDNSEDKQKHQDSCPLDPDDNNIDLEKLQPSPADVEMSECAGASPQVGEEAATERGDLLAAAVDIDMSGEVESIKRQLVVRTEGYLIPQLERLYTRVMKGVLGTTQNGVGDNLRLSILSFLSRFAEDKANFES
ncbi:hypothetical protein MLD38_010932 [Melastoma candidum]|uniref:Uncharacterized protein n=1 Tax=Melastoma candidum TaxID=119954 RepID=A0ACB9R1G1_9MYRT|nr:hypothetical protein MLD38_010932 [Melastoma candidum]